MTVAAVAGCGGGDNKDPVATPRPLAGTPALNVGDSVAADTDSWGAPNGDLANRRRVGGPIDKRSVARLGVAWTAPISATGTFGGYSATPIITGGRVYTQDLESNVEVRSLETGELVWKKDYDSTSVGPNGVAVGEGRVYGATATSAFALDQETGEEIWRVKLTRNANEGIDMAPGLHDGLVYVSTVPGNISAFYKGNGAGVLWALDAASGEKRWSFDTVPKDLWSAEHTKINSGGGLWHPPAFDADGAMYVDVANPAPWPGTEKLPWGASRPGPNKYSNTIVKLDAKTGEMRWHNQVLPHDIWDWDLHLPPVLAEVDGKPVTLAGGKMGYVYAFDPQTGELLWKRAVGKHNGHDADNELAIKGDFQVKMPVTVLPGVLGGVETQMAVDDTTVFAPVVNLPVTFKSQTEQVLDVTKDDGELVALDLATGDVKWTHEFDRAVYGAATVVNDLVFSTTFDGKLFALDTATGDTVWEDQLPAGTNAPVAIAGDTLITAASYPQGKGQRAEIVAYRLDATGTPTRAGTPTPEPTDLQGGGGQKASGEAVFAESCGSCHVLAAAGTNGTTGPDLDALALDASTVQRQVTNGGGGMPAFGGRLSDAEIEAVSKYVASVASGKGGGGGGGGAGTP